MVYPLSRRKAYKSEAGWYDNFGVYFRDSQGQRYVIPKIKISEFISYKYLNNENLLSLIDILNTGDTIVDVENVIQNYKKGIVIV